MYTEEKVRDLLKKAQDTYGYANQISVANEECCELAQVLAKYIRYPDHTTAKIELNDRILDEVADVTICLEHIKMIFLISDIDLDNKIDKKLQRLEKWLDKSTSIYQTTKDREV